jgi:cardiolipin synthase
MMVRIEDPEVTRFFVQDFDATFEGRPLSAEAEFDDLSVYSLDGRSNARGFAAVLAKIENAQVSIRVVSPYLTFPFTGTLAAARRRGVSVEILTPRDNNKPTVQRSLLRDAARFGFSVYLQPGMQHLKAMVIDDRELIAGSSNFDFVSYCSQEEFVVAIQRPTAVKAFLEQVVEPGLAQAGQPATASVVGRPNLLGEAALRIAAVYARLFRGARRGVIAFRHG